jgi:hypothetical protein
VPGDPEIISLRILPLLACAVFCAAAAPAEDRPVLYPTRDVAVTFHATSGAQQGVDLHVAWLAAEQKLRVEPPNLPGWGVLDVKANRLTMVHDGTRSVMEFNADALPGGLTIPTVPPETAHFTRAGTARIAGLTCTVWRYEDGKNQGETCLTADGVMLRGSGKSGGKSGAIEATKVSFGRQDPARFRPPMDYHGLQLPEGLRLAPGFKLGR